MNVEPTKAEYLEYNADWSALNTVMVQRLMLIPKARPESIMQVIIYLELGLIQALSGTIHLLL